MIRQTLEKDTVALRHMPRFRFSLLQILVFFAGCGCVFAMAQWNPVVSVIMTPSVVGPQVSYAACRTRGSALLGLVAAYYGSITLGIPAVLLAVGVASFFGVDPILIVQSIVAVVSVVGGVFAARIELTRDGCPASPGARRH